MFSGGRERVHWEQMGRLNCSKQKCSDSENSMEDSEAVTRDFL